jgi:hypothetical protein
MGVGAFYRRAAENKIREDIKPTTVIDDRTAKE